MDSIDERDQRDAREERERRIRQCQDWNADRDHQAAAGHASFDAFSARWRAEQGLVPLFADAVRRYVLPNMIRGPFGQPLSQELQETIWRAWCAGYLVSVAAWLDDDNDPPPDPAGLWAREMHRALDEPDMPTSPAPSEQ